MKARIANTIDAVRSNFWLLPSFMAVSASVVCFILVSIDSAVDLPVLAGGVSAEDARPLLAALTGALVTALSIVFSSTVVVLALAAAQLGPRVLRNYVRDRYNQVLIGVFISAVLYNLTALFLVGRLDADDGPHLTVIGAMLLSAGTLIVLVYFIHHVARSIQAPNVILAVSVELKSLIVHTYPGGAQGKADGAPPATSASAYLPKAGRVLAGKNGYIQALDTEQLLRLACQHGVVLASTHRPGDLVMEGDVVAEIHTAAPFDAEQLSHDAARAFIIGPARTATQDIEFVLSELVEIAVRALSPSINDPFTAIACVERLAEAIVLLAGREMPPFHHHDDAGELRLVVDQTTFSGVCDAAFNQIRQHGASDVAVLIRVLEALTMIMGYARTEKQRAVLWRHAFMIRRAGERFLEPDDQRDLEERFGILAARFGPTPEEKK